MKKFYLILLALSCASLVTGQPKKMLIPADRYAKPVPVITCDVPELPVLAGNASVNSKAMLEDIIGGSRYDLQTNYSIAPRLSLFPDGTLQAAWTMGFTEPGFTDRGTGYNYFNGTEWMPEPTTRIENTRTGWPCIQPWNGNGEIIVCHKAGTTDIVISTRPAKGTGNWTQITKTPPSGVSGIGWPRIITSGPNHNYIHMILITTPTGNGGVVYQGLDGAILYYRSLDGGATWDKNGILFPQMTSADYSGFSPDTYAWGSPHGDTIYFALGGSYTDTFIMKSNDNGNTWEKIPVLSNANKKIPSGTQYLPPWKSSDGSMAVEMDLSGILHLAFGVGGGFIEAGSHYIMLNYNGLVYWNSTMPMVQDSLDLDTLEANGQLLGAVYNGPGPGDTIIGVPNYRVGLSSFPQITVDDYNNIYFIWSAATPGNPSPDDYNYRHLWGRVKFHDRPYMTPQMDLNEGIIYAFQEYVFESVAKKTRNNNLQIIYQTSSQPGSNLDDANIPVHDVSIEFRSVPVSTFFPTGIGPAKPGKGFTVSQNYPNPSRGSSSFDLTLHVLSGVILELTNITGEKVMTADKGMLRPGKHRISLGPGTLAPGIYFYTVKVNGEAVTKKMLVD